MEEEPALDSETELEGDAELRTESRLDEESEPDTETELDEETNELELGLGEAMGLEVGGTLTVVSVWLEAVELPGDKMVLAEELPPEDRADEDGKTVLDAVEIAPVDRVMLPG